MSTGNQTMLTDSTALTQSGHTKNSTALLSSTIKSRLVLGLKQLQQAGRVAETLIACDLARIGSDRYSIGEGILYRKAFIGVNKTDNKLLVVSVCCMQRTTDKNCA
jgi:hypothetical protein